MTDEDGWLEEYHPLDGRAPPEYVPSVWTAEHCGVRIVQAFETLALLPRAGGPAGFKSNWPAMAITWEDRLAQADLTPAERRERERAQNRTRVLPTAEQLGRLDRVNAWIWLLSRGGRDVGGVTWWAVQRARSEHKGGWPTDDLEWLAEALNFKGEAVF